MAGDPDVLIAGLPKSTPRRARGSTRSIDAAIFETFESLPRAKRRDPDFVCGAVERAVRNAVDAPGARSRRCTCWSSRCKGIESRRPRRSASAGRMHPRDDHDRKTEPCRHRRARSRGRGRALSRQPRRARLRAGGAARARRDGRVRRTAEHARSNCSSRSAQASPIAKFLEKNPDGGMHHVCFEVDDILAARDALKAVRRARARRRRAEDRRPRQAGAVPASEGFQRNADRDRAGLEQVVFRLSGSDRHRERQRSDPDEAAAAIPKSGSRRFARDDDGDDST